jgi:hypothetical protein
MSESFTGEVYFRISEQLGWLPSEVIRKKFTPDIRFLIMKHSQRLRKEIEQAKELEEQTQKNK